MHLPLMIAVTLFEGCQESISCSMVLLAEVALGKD
jgi:hypothetical protein